MDLDLNPYFEKINTGKIIQNKFSDLGQQAVQEVVPERRDTISPSYDPETVFIVQNRNMDPKNKSQEDPNF